MQDFTDAQYQYREMIGRFMAEHASAGAARKQMESAKGCDIAVWQKLARELGVVGAHIPESYGGGGFGFVEACITLEEAGRHLYCGPYFASALMGGYALLDAGTEEAKQRFLPTLASGEEIFTVALDNLDSAENVGEHIRVGAGETLSGEAAQVIDAHLADRLLVFAPEAGGLSLFSIEAKAAGVAIEPLEPIDQTRKLARVQFEGAAAERVSEKGAVEIRAFWEKLSVLLACESLGGARALLEETLDYMKNRFQFGRPIASFQSLKHKCAELYTELGLVEAACHRAAMTLEDNTHAPGVANMAKSMASEHYSAMAAAAIQLHGGMGFTWENDTQLWFKRAKSSEFLFGTPNWHREQMIARVEEANA